MESRKITVVTTNSQGKKVIMSSATTLKELKKDFDANNIDYYGMTFFEGLSKTELKTDDSILPHDVPYKGEITNNLVFMLTVPKKKITSGADPVSNRKEAYRYIKANNLGDEIKSKFGKNFTNCTTTQLMGFCNHIVFDGTNAPITPTTKDKSPVQEKEEIDTTNNIMSSIKTLATATLSGLGTLHNIIFNLFDTTPTEAEDLIYSINDSMNKIKSILLSMQKDTLSIENKSKESESSNEDCAPMISVSKPKKEEVKSDYDDDEIDSMFDF